MAAQPKILLLIPHLGGGGAEQVMLLLARGLSRDKYDIHLGLITEAQFEPDAVPAWVSVHPLGAKRVRTSVFRLLRLIWRLRPAVILSGISHLNFLVLLLKPLLPRGTKVLVRQNSTISRSLAHDALPPYTLLLYKALYRHADSVICQSRAMAADLIGVLGLRQSLISVLPNPLDYEAILNASTTPSRWTSSGPNLLAIGRLSTEKGYDLLLEALPAVRQQYPSLKLTILGSGPEELSLKAQCRALYLDEAVNFAGYERKPYTYFPGATLFVLSSRHEGMPNALLEALAGGLPVVATPASGGVAALLATHPRTWITYDISITSIVETLLKALLTLEPADPGTGG
jgi:glycosyltransferase involved in cell wall biosynthesis